MLTANSADGRSTTRWVLVAFLIIVLAFAVWLIRDILMLTLTAAIFAILMSTPIRFFVRRGMKRPLAVLVSILLALILVVLTFSLILPQLLGQVNQLVTETLPRAADQIQVELTPTNLQARFPFLKDVDISNIIEQIKTQVTDTLTHLPGQLFPFFGGVASTLLSILIVFFLALYFIADPDTHQRGLLRLVPVSYRSRAREILVMLDLTLRRFLQAQLLLMLLIGLATGIALALMGVPLSTALGTITGLFSFVPNFGPLLALIPILAVAIINTPDKILLIIIVYYSLQLIQSQVITPLLLGQGIDMPPAMILLSQIVAGIFFGFMGLLLAVPLSAIVIVLVREIYIKDILGDYMDNSGTTMLTRGMEGSALVRDSL